MSKPHRDPEVLERLYHEEGMTLEAIGEQLGVHHTTVVYNMKNLGIERRSHGGPDPVSASVVAEDIARVWDDLGGPPSQREYDELGEYSRSTARDRFGRWNLAVAEARKLR